MMGRRITQEEFIERSTKLYNSKYNYNSVVYKGSHIKVKIICPIHGEFLQSPWCHLRGGCNQCGRKIADIKHKVSLEEFIERSNKIHNNKYDYKLVEYKGTLCKVIIICPIHGKFEQLARHHLAGNGCPTCNQSHGETKIEQYLINHKISYIPQKRFTKCRYKIPLRFDFYLPEYNLCIEYDGRLHYTAVSYFGGRKTLNYVKLKDKIKTKYCKRNNIQLLRIPYYKENHIEKILKEYLLIPGIL